MTMQIKKLKEYNSEPKDSIANRYDTKKHSFIEPGIKLIIGQRNSGKTHTAVKLLMQCQKENLFDNILLITPTYQSNASFWKQFDIPEENVFYPSRDAIQNVINRIEADRDDFENHLVELELYERFKRETKNKNTIARMEAENLNEYMNMGYINENGYIMNKIVKPEWKYEHISNKLRPVTTALILDDVLGSTALASTEAFTKLCIMNRHIAPLSQPFGNRQALGVSVFILAQSYTGQNAIPRSCRENATDLILFENKQKQQLKKIKEELASAIDENQFQQAYDYAIQKKHDNLTISFSGCPEKRFRRNLNECIVFEKCNCHKKG